MGELVKGHVASGYERVRELYERDFARGSDVDSQLCVYVRGERVVDLWGSHGPKRDTNYGPDSMQMIFSSGKTVASICVACLIDRGLLNYNDRVSRHWPEFAQNGKENLKICDILRHEGGMPWFHQTIPASDLLPEQLKKNNVGKIIEAEGLMFPPESWGPREYHEATRGYILNEIFRRVDQGGRTMGEFLREEIAGKLGVDIVFGATESELTKISDMKWWFGLGIFQSMWPKCMGRKSAVGFWEIMGKVSKMKDVPGREKPPPLLDIVPESGMTEKLEVMNKRAFKMAESPSAGTVASARGLAKLAAAMADQGQVPEGGPRLMSAETWSSMHAEPTKHTIYQYQETNFSQGGVNFYGVNGQWARQPNPHGVETDPSRSKYGDMGFVGWIGASGSVMQWHPELEIGFGYAPTLSHFLDFDAKKAERLQRAVIECIKNIKK